MVLQGSLTILFGVATALVAPAMSQAHIVGDFGIFDISTQITDDRKFSDAAATADGRVVFPPANANAVGVFNPSDNSFTLVDISTQISSATKFYGAAATADGRVVFAPATADAVGVFNPSDSSFTLVDISTQITGDTKFYGAAATADGRVVFAPSSADAVGVFNPSDDSFTVVDISTQLTGGAKFRGAVATADGRVVFAPFNAGAVGVFNPSDSSFTLVDISTQLTGNAKFFGAAAAADGRVVFTPFGADAVGVFNPSDSSFTLVDISTQITGNGKFRGATATADGRVVFAPSNAGAVGVFNPSDSSSKLVDISTQLTGNGKFRGATATADGRVVFAPHFADAVGVFELAAQTPGDADPHTGGEVEGIEVHWDAHIEHIVFSYAGGSSSTFGPVGGLLSRSWTLAADEYVTGVTGFNDPGSSLLVCVQFQTNLQLLDQLCSTGYSSTGAYDSVAFSAPPGERVVALTRLSGAAGALTDVVVAGPATTTTTASTTTATATMTSTTTATNTTTSTTTTTWHFQVIHKGALYVEANGIADPSGTLSDMAYTCGQIIQTMGLSRLSDIFTTAMVQSIEGVESRFINITSIECDTVGHNTELEPWGNGDSEPQVLAQQGYLRAQFTATMEEWEVNNQSITQADFERHADNDESESTVFRDNFFFAMATVAGTMGINAQITLNPISVNHVYIGPVGARVVASDGMTTSTSSTTTTTTWTTTTTTTEAAPLEVSWAWLVVLCIAVAALCLCCVAMGLWLRRKQRMDAPQVCI